MNNAGVFDLSIGVDHAAKEIVRCIDMTKEGDDLEEDDNTLEYYLTHESPVSLKNILASCKNRCVLFDNKPTNESNGKVCGDEKLKEVKTKLEQKLEEDEKEARVIAEKREEDIVKDKSSNLEYQLAKAREERVKAEEGVQKIQEQYNEEIRRLSHQLQHALK
ncbi:unnamed protein product [Citrullus colocynthis]|uniref:AIG1-type G domain-containing protein n=1 Tax=Citrullus colocynthis TaxID=252529 RepID=A0ABP0Z9S0_9ROSI